jgi:hypothetical protein
MIFHLFLPVKYSLLPEAVTQERRFCVPDSVPVPLSKSDLKVHLIVNALGMCPVSGLYSSSPT